MVFQKLSDLAPPTYLSCKYVFVDFFLSLLTKLLCTLYFTHDLLFLHFSYSLKNFFFKKWPFSEHYSYKGVSFISDRPAFLGHAYLLSMRLQVTDVCAFVNACVIALEYHFYVKNKPNITFCLISSIYRSGCNKKTLYQFFFYKSSRSVKQFP